MYVYVKFRLSYLKGIFDFIDFQEQKMNRNDLVQSTGKIAIYLKTYNFKLCRKGLLERAKNMNLEIGDFSNLENTFLKNVVNTNQGFKCLDDFDKGKLRKMDLELESLRKQTESLAITIKNCKERVRLGTNNEFYSAWIKKIDNLSKRFKQKFSIECNELYDHHYRLNKRNEQDWNNIEYDIRSINSKIKEYTTDGNNVQNNEVEVKGNLSEYAFLNNLDEGFLNNLDEGDLNKIFEEVEKYEEPEKIEEHKQPDEKANEQPNEKHNDKKRKQHIEENEEENKDGDKNSTKKIKLSFSDLVPISDEELTEDEENNEIIIVDEVGSVEIGEFHDIINENLLS